jgi:vacuolar-type H+-ATPase subunit C/Vma6
MGDKRRINGSRYIYATGRIRACEVRLISAARLNRYLEARSTGDIGRLLVENGYPAAADPEVSLRLELEATYALVRSIAADREFCDILLLLRDFHNLKVMLKAFSVYWPRRDAAAADAAAVPARQGRTADSRLPAESETGTESLSPGQSRLWPEIHGPVTYEQVQLLLQHPATLDPREMFRALRDRKPERLPPELAQAAAAAAGRYQHTYDISEIDILLDQAAAQTMTDRMKKLNEPFFAGYLSLRFDLVNIGLLLRTRFLQSGADYLRRILLPGGTLAPASLVACYDEPVSGLGRILAKAPFARLAATAGLRKAIGQFAEGGDAIARFSQAADDLLIEYVRQARLVLRGPEALVGYLIARETEIRTVRMILTCLRNQIPVEKARGLARLTYL